MSRKLIEFRFQMDGKVYTEKMYNKIIPEDPVLNLAKHEAATLKLDGAPSRKEFDLTTKMGLVRLNLEI